MRQKAPIMSMLSSGVTSTFLTNLRKLESEGRGVGVEGGIGLNVG